MPQEREGRVNRLLLADNQEVQKDKGKDKGYAWVILGSAVFLATLNTAVLGSYGILLPEYVDYFRVSKFQVSVIQFLALFSTAGFGFVSGGLTKIFGARKVALGSAVVSTVGFVVSSAVDNLYVLYISHGVLPGASIPLNLIPVLVTIPEYFKRRKAFAYGMHSTGLAFGFIVWPIVLRLLLNAYSRRGAMLVYAGVQLNGLVAAALLRPVNRLEKAGDADAGTEMEALSHSEKVSQDAEETTDGFAGRQTGGCSKVLNALDFMAEKKLLLYILSYTLIMIGYFIPYVFTPARAQQLHINKEHAAILVSVLAFSGLVFRPLIGLLGDRIPGHRTILYGLAGLFSGLLTAVSYSMKNFTALTVYSCLLGASMAGYSSLHATVMSDLLPLQHQLSIASGIKSTVSGVFNALANLVAGWLVDATTNFGTPFLVMGLIQTLGGVAGILVFILQRYSQPQRASAKSTN